MTSAGVREHLRSNVVGYVALFLVVAGGAASALPGRNTIDSGDIKRGQVKTSDLATGAVGSAKVADDALTGADVDESSLSLPPIPSRCRRAAQPAATSTATTPPRRSARPV
jgi:hypothetical protein